MNELELQTRVNATVDNVVKSLLYQNNIPAHQVEIALVHSLADIRTEVINEILVSKQDEKNEKQLDEQEVDNG